MCEFARFVIQMTGKAAKCSSTQGLLPHQACANCRLQSPFFVDYFCTREIDASLVQAVQTKTARWIFPLPLGRGLIVFGNRREAMEFIQGSSTRVVEALHLPTKQDQSLAAVGFHCCPTCHQLEVLPTQNGQFSPSLTCSTKDAQQVPGLYTRSPIAKKKSQDEKSAHPSFSFTFGIDSFPFEFSLPGGWPAGHPPDPQTGGTAGESKDGANAPSGGTGASAPVCFLDDVVVPFKLCEKTNTLIIRIEKNPFEKMYRPGILQPCLLQFPLRVYRQGPGYTHPVAGLDLTGTMTSLQNIVSSPARQQVELYSVCLRF